MDNLLHRQGFFRELGKWINLYELVFDIAIIIIAGVVYRIAAPVSGLLLIDIGPLGAVTVMGLSEFFLMLFFGQIYRRYEDPKLKKPLILDAFSGLILYIAILGLFFSMPSMIYVMLLAYPDISKGVEFAIVPISGAFIILGVSLGFPLKNYGDVEPFLSLPISLTVILGILGVLYIVFSFGILPALLYMAFPVIAIIVHYILKARSKLDIVPKPGNRVLKVIVSILLPVFAALALSVWQEVVVIRAVITSEQSPDVFNWQNLLLLMLTSGLIPIRILAALAPPYKPVNTVFAVLSLTFYFFSIFGAVERYHVFILR